MKQIVLITIILISNSTLFAQPLQQIVETWPIRYDYEVGTPPLKRKVQYLNNELEVIKEEYFDPNGVEVASYNIDPITKKFHGEFFDGSNKGSYNQGILTADNFKFVDKESRTNSKPASLVVLNVKDGIVVGKLTKYVPNTDGCPRNICESEIEYMVDRCPPAYEIELDNFIRYQLFISSNYNKWIFEYKIDSRKEPDFRTTKYELNYDENGLLHGIHYLDRFYTMYFEHGECTGILTYDGETGYNEFDDNDRFVSAHGYALDSVFREKKIWRRNFKLIKNCGFVEAYTLPNLYNIGQFRLLTHAAINYNYYNDYERYNSEKIFTGTGPVDALTFFNSDNSVLPNYISENPNIFLFEYRTASLHEPGFYVNTQSTVRSVRQEQREVVGLQEQSKMASIDHYKMLFALQQIHCWISTYGSNHFDDINFYTKPIEQFENHTMEHCQGCRIGYMQERFPQTFWLDGSIGGSGACDIYYDSIGYFNKTSYFVLNQLRHYTEISKANELFVKVYFINKNLKKWSDEYTPYDEIILYAIDEVIDFERLKKNKEEILQQFENEKNEMRSKITTVISSIDVELKNEHWELLLPLSKQLDSLVEISDKNEYQIIFSDPRERFQKEKDTNFDSYVKDQIKLKKIEADYTALINGLEKLATELNLEFRTNINLTGNTTDLFNRLITKESSIQSYLDDIEKRILLLYKTIEDYFSPIEKITLDIMNGDGVGPIYYSLHVAVDKPSNDFLVDKKSLRQEWKSHTPTDCLLTLNTLQKEWKSNSAQLLLQFSSYDINKFVFCFGSISEIFEYK
jgi:hypothetical protein